MLSSFLVANIKDMGSDIEFGFISNKKQVVVRGCRALESIIPGPDHGLNKFEWFSMGFKPIEISNKNSNGFTQEGFLFAQVYEWRLNMETGEVKERNLTGTDFSMEFPMINEDLTGVKHKYGYTQVLDSMASSSCGELVTRIISRILLSMQLTIQATFPKIVVLIRHGQIWRSSNIIL